MYGIKLAFQYARIAMLSAFVCLSISATAQEAYPLCQGMWPSSSTKESETRQKAAAGFERVNEQNAFLKAYDWVLVGSQGGAASAPTFSASATGAFNRSIVSREFFRSSKLEPFATQGYDDVVLQQAFGLPLGEPSWSSSARPLSSSSARTIESVAKRLKSADHDVEKWAALERALRTLPPSRQEQVLHISGFEPGRDVLSMPSALVVKRADDATRVAEMYALGSVLDPEVRRALSFDSLDMSDQRSVLQAANSPSMRFWSQQAATSRDLAAGLRMGPDPRVQIVGNGDPTRPGGLGNVPKGSGPVAFGRSSTGAPCIRPANATDISTYDLKKGSTARLWDPKAFPDVGLLIWKKDDNKLGICSFVRLSRNHIVTAAHCVATQGTMVGYSLVDYSKSIEALALLPKLTETPRKPSACFSNPEECGFHVARVGGTALVAKQLTWNQPSKIPKPDVALLKVTFPPATHMPATTLVGNVESPERITLAGYGLTLGPSGGLSGSLRVGWQSRPPQMEKTAIVWAVNHEQGFAGTCAGDSGGAVFHGDLASPKQEPRVLIGLVSYGSGQSEAEGIEGCLQLVAGTATRLDVQRDWLCEKSSNMIFGCDAESKPKPSAPWNLFTTFPAGS